MRKIFYLLLVFAFAANAQQAPVHYPTPATVWDFTKYGNTPVSEYKGLVNLNIPLYKITVDNVSLPLDMNYYTGGIRVSEEAGLIGLGWTVNTSIPMIVQQIKDKNDYNFTTSFQQLPPYQGGPILPMSEMCQNPYGQFLGWGSEWPPSSSAFQTLPEIPADIPYFRFVAMSKVIDYNGYYNINNDKYKEMFEPTNTMIDTEPDIFTVNIDGRQIKFCRPQIQTQSVSSTALVSMPMVVLDGAGYTVNMLPSTNSQNGLTIGGIVVNCPNGSRYTFTVVEKANAGAGDFTSINYKLSEIKTYTGKTINFNYSPMIWVGEPDKIDARYVRRNGLTQTDNQSSSAAGTKLTSTDGLSPAYCGSFNVNEVDLYCEVPSHVYYQYYFLESITTPAETILFSSSSRQDNPTMKKLDNVQIKNLFSQKVKQFNFDYDYFASDDNGTKRLKLLSLTEEGSEPYTFEYNATQLPKKNSYSIDYWGFYNGHPNTSFKPDLTELGYPQFTENVINDFKSNIDYTKACSLEKITYPTKGYTVFEYESHFFDNLALDGSAVTPINYGGGLRIKSVTDYNFDNQVISKKSYSYFGGKCINKRVMTKGSTEVVGYGTQSVLVVSTPVIIASINNFINQSTNSAGDYIGYDRVVIKQEGNSSIGTTEKKFTNNENRSINPNLTYYTTTMNYTDSNDIENGNVIEENIYNDLNQLQLKKTSSYINRNYNAGYGMSKQSSGTRIYDKSDANHAEVLYYPVTLATFYPINDKKSYLSSEVTTEYFGENSKTITKNYDINPNGKIVDETAQEDAAIFQNRNITIEHTTWNGELPLIKTKKVNNILTETQNFTYEGINNYIRLKEVEVFPFGNTNLSNKKMYYDIYDSASNINQYHSENGMYTCVVWGYNKTLPIAKIENAKYANIQQYCTAIVTASNTNDENGLLTALQTFRNTINTQFPESFVTTYTHIPLVGISTITDAKGNKANFFYDSFGKLIMVKQDGDTINEYEYNYKPQN